MISDFVFTVKILKINQTRYFFNENLLRIFRALQEWPGGHWCPIYSTQSSVKAKAVVFECVCVFSMNEKQLSYS